MDEQADHVSELQSKTEQITYEFVRTELARCFSAVENGIRALESGNRECAQEECEKAENGYKTIVGYVAEVSDEGPRAEVEKRWNEVRTRLDVLQSMLKDSDSE